jgi:hypothetical protein
MNAKKQFFYSAIPEKRVLNISLFGDSTIKSKLRGSHLSKHSQRYRKPIFSVFISPQQYLEQPQPTAKTLLCYTIYKKYWYIIVGDE